MGNDNTIWRKPTVEDQKAVLRFIKRSAILNCTLLGFGVAGCVFIDIVGTSYYLRESYAIPLIVIMQVLILGMVVMLLFLMKDFIRRFLHVIRKEYDVTDCIIIEKRKELGYRCSHHYVTIGFGGTQQEELFTQTEDYYDAQVGSNELVIRYLVKKTNSHRLQDDLIIRKKQTEKKCHERTDA